MNKPAEKSPRAKAPARKEPHHEPESAAVRERKCQIIVEKYSKWGFGAGLIPAPAFDLVALTAIQMKMVTDIAEVYGQSFSDNKIKSIVGPLLGAALPQTLTTGGISSTLKAIPVFGTVAGMATMPIISAAVTYGVGRTFVNHFAGGGSLLDIDLKHMEESVEHFADKYRHEKDHKDEHRPA